METASCVLLLDFRSVPWQVSFSAGAFLWHLNHLTYLTLNQGAIRFSFVVRILILQFFKSQHLTKCGAGTFPSRLMAVLSTCLVLSLVIVAGKLSTWSSCQLRNLLSNPDLSGDMIQHIASLYIYICVLWICYGNEYIYVLLLIHSYHFMSWFAIPCWLHFGTSFLVPRQRPVFLWKRDLCLGRVCVQV